MIIKEPLVKEFLEEHEDGVIFYRVYSPTEGNGILLEETGVVYGEVAVTDDDPYTYSEYVQPAEDELQDEQQEEDTHEEQPVEDLPEEEAVQNASIRHRRRNK